MPAATLLRGTVLLAAACAAVPSAAATQSPARVVQFRWDNDIIALRGSGPPADRDYSNGVEVRITAADSAGERFSAALGQRIYTPGHDGEQPVAGERPYAGWLYLRGSASRRYSRRLDELTVEIGIVGPQSGGEQVQNLIHRWVGSEPQRGWRHQLRREPAAAVFYRGTWPARWRSVELRPYLEGGAGTLWTGAAGGVTSRASNGKRFFGELTLGGELVARNLFLHGNILAPGVTVRAVPVVGRVETAVGVRLGSTALEYRYTLRTIEYRTQERPHGYGSLVVRRY